MHITYWITRIIIGDTLFGLSIWACCVLAYLLANAAKRWGSGTRLLYFVILSFCLMALAHYAVDQLQLWYITPINEPMHIIR